MSRNRRNKRDRRIFIDNYSKQIKIIIPIIIIFICIIVLIIKEYKTNKQKKETEILSNELFNANIELTEEEKIELQEEIKKDVILSLSVVGNTLCENEILNSVQNKDYNFSNIFNNIKKYTNEADVVIAPVETNFVKQNYSGDITYNSPNKLLEEMKNIGIDIVLTSNNHSLDYGVKGIQETIESFRVVGLENVGTKSNKEDSNILIKEYRNIKLAFLSYTYGTNKKEENYENYINIINKENIQKDIQSAKEQGAEYIIVGMHWGNTFSSKLNESQKELSEFLINSGVDIILGNHPAVIQKMQTCINNEGKDVLLVNSLGNFLSSQNSKDANLGMILNIELIKLAKDNKVYLNKVTYIPTYIQDKGKDSENRYNILDIKEEISNYDNGIKNIDEKLYKKLKDGLIKIKELING